MSETSIPSVGHGADRSEYCLHLENGCPWRITSRMCAEYVSYHIKGLRSLRTSLDSSTADVQLGVSIVIVTPGLLFNSLLIGTSRRNIHRLQMVQNNLARVVSGVNFR